MGTSAIHLGRIRHGDWIDVLRSILGKEGVRAPVKHRTRVFPRHFWLLADATCVVRRSIERSRTLLHTIGKPSPTIGRIGNILVTRNPIQEALGAHAAQAATEEENDEC